MSDEKQPTFEENLTTLETIVSQLEQGDIPLEQALDQFQKGVALSKSLQSTLQDAEKTLTTMMNDSDQEVAFETPQGGTGDAD
ncbi:exodeoxyribonuclease VII small subunit [Levilactobacillus mulengensis]|uniref:exodeoxyribonuclease VII small subunit n=1 Tax=Levilactobacillus mulengensis TaxID=2486025 RepID=UPI000F7A2B3A|nr:exodeoxyribonuclease VII small subunit [Levilactobacillus mulengensis]